MKFLGPDIPNLIILPVYSALPNEMQTRIFEPVVPGSRKVTTTHFIVAEFENYILSEVDYVYVCVC